MTLAIVQHTSGHGTGSGSPPGSLTLTSTPTAGNLILVGLQTSITAASLVFNTTDYVVINKASALDGSGSLIGSVLGRYVQSGDTVTLPNFCTSGNTAWAATVYEVSGVSGAYAADILAVANFQESGATLVYTTTPITTVANNSLALAFYGRVNATTNTSISGSGWTQDEAGNSSTNYGDYGCASNLISTSGTAAQVTITFPASGASKAWNVIVLTPSQPTYPVVRQARSVSKSGTLGSYTLQTAPVTGNLLIANILWRDGTAANPTIGTGWTTFGSALNGSLQSLISVYRYVQAGDASGLPALISSGSQKSAVDILEISGVSGTFAGDFVKYQSAYQASGASMTTTADATNNTNQLVLSTFGNYNATTLLTSSSSGYDFIANDTFSTFYGSWGTLRQFFPTSGSSVQSAVTTSASANPTSYIQQIFGAPGPLSVNLSSTSSASAVGSFTPVVATTVNLVGASAAGSAGSLSKTINPSPSSVSATGAVQSFTVSISSASVNISLTGISSASAARSFAPSLSPTLVSATSAAVAIAISAVSGPVIALIRVSASGAVGTFLIDIESSIAIEPVYSIMRNSPVPTQGSMANTIVACEGAFI